MANEASCIQESIIVNVPLTTAYDQWTQFEEFPRFMDGIEWVKQLDDTHLHWCASIGGKKVEWRAQIIEQVPDQRIVWQSTSGSRNAGTVWFEPMSERQTRVTLKVEYEPEGVVEYVGDVLGVVRWRVKGDLDRFKEFIEQRGAETGAWRGRVSATVPDPRRDSLR
jgi:uncharacterized membrane protein